MLLIHKCWEILTIFCIFYLTFINFGIYLQHNDQTTNLFAHDCIHACTVSDVCLIHHYLPLLFPEDHECIQGLFNIRAILI